MASALSIVQCFFPKVHTIVDATKPLQIEVTAKDAKTNGKKDHQHCAMATACQRAMKLDGALVSRSMAYMVKGEIATRYTLPPSIQKEIVSFDRGAPFEPGTYVLGRISASAKLTGRMRGSVKKKWNDKANKAKRFQHLTGGVRTALKN